MSSTPAGRAYSASRDDHLRRLARIEGQVRGIMRMVAQDQYFIDVVTQTAAVTRALQAVALGLLDDHLARCVSDAAHEGGSERAATLQEASVAIGRLVRS